MKFRIKPALARLSQWMSVIGVSFLGLSVFFSALVVVYNKHYSRQLFTKLQTLQQETELLQVEWTQLLLEQRTWASDARVERIAEGRLQMRLPEPNEVRVIQPNAVRQQQ